ncbi:MAG TPA: trypsin-like serine protease, partial [Myxococcota bacterium]|nr:trypsin-like serine protease [Myxococcota bacterium]
MSPSLRWGSLSLLTAALACAGSEPPGTLDLEGSVSEDRIVGGAAFSGAPGVGSLLRNGAPHCTGTLIDNRRVVTAAHCFHSNATPSSWRFVTGSNANAPDKVYSVASIRVHSGFNLSTVLNDVAVVTLSTTATETPLKVLDNLDSTWLGAELFFVGYGVDNGQRQSGMGVKRAVSMPISEIGSSQFAYETAGKNTCSGDSGGPAFFVDQQGTFLLA